MLQKPSTNSSAYVVTVDMGYGHQRAAFPLRDFAVGLDGVKSEEAIINANHYAGIPNADRRRWESGRKLYESVSRVKNWPLVGERLFSVMDYFQRIEPFYPKRDLSRPTFQLRSIYSMIRKGWGKDLIERLNKSPLPLVSAFFSPAYFAEEHGYKGDIYLLCCDTDVSRAWAPLVPAKSRIKYLVPNRRVKERLGLYGVKADQIFITGFPLPKENIGGRDLRVLKKSLGERVAHLDPDGRYRKKYHETLEEFLGDSYRPFGSEVRHPLTITFAVGGAGAQKDLGAQILTSLRHHVDKGLVRLNLVAGTRNDVYLFYQRVIKELGLLKKQNGHVSILFADNKLEYFKKFNQILLTTDVLWTKPSELSFYAGLGLPIIMAPTVGSQEVFNKSWLESTGAGVQQEDPKYTHEWLFDWLKSGWLAEAAMNGFLDAPRNGAYHIEEVVLRGKRSEIEDIHLL
ncbi:MAG: hypothetical protein HZC26_01600 [Candidatus Magasanikbacteria bacterium]|nr:hypothetical protein [Candidatus Magasanikbacteria bacterium]MBI5222567.1 hypothetical protein [Candidatus Magasanikbacteria bacterium]